MSVKCADLSILELPEVQSLIPKSKSCVARLLEHKADDNIISKTNYPSSKCAAVLVLLYQKDGELRVLLTTRSKSLRSHPFQTACPGGKVDSGDKDRIGTALREANEEIGLPTNLKGLHFLCYIRPFISLYRILVTPIVMLLTDLSVLDRLEPSVEEVDHIFDHPLEAILDPNLVANYPLAEKGSELWPYETEFYATNDNIDTPVGPYRMHRLRSSYTPVKGLTADILITVAEIAYGRGPSYERCIPGQPDPIVALSNLLIQQSNGKSEV
ncbi:hypothetical protein M422DRAFT_223313 [Sphaerobolus stellatus SS14]|nr:hypothetical protein M422DRAFT_223313 [Sphaerobolus stellatus SS14]